MAARASPKAHTGRPPSPPSDGDVSGVLHFFKAQAPRSVPPSLPASPPDSPVRRRERTSSSIKPSPVQRTHEQPSTSSSRQRGQQPESPTSYTKLAFPSIISDDDDWSPLVGGAPDDPASWSAQAGQYRSGAANRRTWSQTTTTTTLKTERRSYRYSVPSSHELLDGEEAATSSHAHPSFGATRSPTQRRNSLGHQSRSSPSRHSLSSASHSRPRSPSTNSAPRRRPSSPASSRPPRISDPSRKPSRLYQSFSDSPSHPSRSRALSPRPASPFGSASFNQYSLTTTTHSLFKPVMSLFVFLTITAFACFSISAVLLASFSMTFYDDCGRRLIDFQKGIGAGRKRVKGSIDGVKFGMERLAGGARGALELAAWATVARMPTVRAAPTVILSDPEEDSEAEWEFSPSATRPSSPKPSRNRPVRLRRRSTLGSSRRPAFDRGSSAPPPPFDANLGTERERQSSNTWTDDEDATPYDVPHTTPWGSRPASPPPPLHRRSSPSSPRPDSMPPRPPLRILIPSVFCALLFTLVKVVWALWRSERADAMRGSSRGRSAAR